MKAVLDSRQLLAVLVLAKTRSFTLAAKELFLTQSAVSHAIRSLENDLDCRLFERTTRGVALTPVGKLFLEYAEKTIAEMKAARAMVERERPVGDESGLPRPALPPELNRTRGGVLLEADV